MGYCCVPLCTKGRGPKKVTGFSLHRFPVDEKECNRWIKLIRRKDYEWSMESRICSWHFPKGKEAGPTRFPWNEKKNFELNGLALPNHKRRKVLLPMPTPENQSPPAVESKRKGPNVGRKTTDPDEQNRIGNSRSRTTIRLRDERVPFLLDSTFSSPTDEPLETAYCPTRNSVQLPGDKGPEFQWNILHAAYYLYLSVNYRKRLITTLGLENQPDTISIMDINEQENRDIDASRESLLKGMAKCLFCLEPAHCFSPADAESIAKSFQKFSGSSQQLFSQGIGEGLYCFSCHGKVQQVLQLQTNLIEMQSRLENLVSGVETLIIESHKPYPLCLRHNNSQKMNSRRNRLQESANIRQLRNKFFQLGVPEKTCLSTEFFTFSEESELEPQEHCFYPSKKAAVLSGATKYGKRKAHLSPAVSRANTSGKKESDKLMLDPDYGAKPEREKLVAPVKHINHDHSYVSDCHHLGVQSKPVTSEKKTHIRDIRMGFRPIFSGSMRR